MFTGIVESTGKVIKFEGAEGADLEIATSIEGLTPGDSIAVNGVCLTVTSNGAHGNGLFSADVSEETKHRTTLGSLSSGARVNLERPIAAGDRLGGHIVQGHVDGTGRVAGIEQLEASTEMTIDLDPNLLRYVIEKGSIAVDGVSLTASSLGDSDFSVALIPHTLEVTNLGDLRPGDRVNIEVDMMAKYVEKLVKLFREDRS